MDSIEARKQRWDEFLNVKSDMRNVFIVEFCDRDCGGAWPNPDKKRERIEWALKLWEYEMEQMQWLKDDKVPYIRNTTGTEIFAEAFGCKVYRPDDNMPFAVPLVTNSAEAARLKVPDLYSSTLAYLFEMADELKARAGKDAIMGLPDIQTPMDVAALIWEKTSFFAAMIEEPQAVKELAEKVRQLQTAFLDEWFKRYGKEFISHFPRYFMRQGVTVSEDEIGCVNTQMFDEFFLPELVALSDRYGGIGIHCCANARHQWDGIKKVPNLKLVNLYVKAEEAFEFFEDCAAQWNGWWGSGDAETWLDQLPSKKAHSVIHVQAESRDEAVRIAQALWKACGRD